MICSQSLLVWVRAQVASGCAIHCQDPHTFKELKRCVSRVQSNVRDIPAMLGLGFHPLLSDRHPARAKGVTDKLIRRIVYHCDLNSMFMDLSNVQKTIEKSSASTRKWESQQAFQDEANAMREPDPVCDILLRRCAWEHVSSSFDNGTFFSMPISEDGLEFQDLSSRLASLSSQTDSSHEPAAMNLDASANLCEFECDFDLSPTIARDVVVWSPGEVHAEQPCPKQKFFKVLKAGAHKQVCVKPAPGVSRWLSSGDMAVTQHREVHRNGDEVSVSAKPTVFPSQVIASPVSLLRTDFTLAHTSLVENLQVWSSRFSFALGHLDADVGLPFSEVQATLAALVEVDAFPGSGYSLSVKQLAGNAVRLQVLQRLLECGVVQTLVVDDSYSSWEFTEQGLSRVQPVHVLFQPKPALALEPGKALSDMTTWDLWQTLAASGWSVSVQEPSFQPPPYEPEGAKIIYVKSSWGTINRLNLLALASSGAIFAAGIGSIKCWSTAQYYQCLVDNKPIPARRNRRAEPSAIEAEEVYV
jgi:hypothetical protein